MTVAQSIDNAMNLDKLPDGHRGDVVRAAISQLGKSEPEPYWQACGLDAPYPKHWCGAFTLWCLKQAGLADDYGWRIGLGYLYRLPRTQSPEIGDIVYFERHQHHAILRGIYDADMHTIDGNQPDVKIRIRHVDEAAGFYSIRTLIETARGKDLLDES